ncbi:MAG: hypothetical protein QMD09_04200 [Desulfatibacillaceae bacterium]|nr:hypothetical protein [Desulfatibacillaceae bacterium]
MPIQTKTSFNSGELSPLLAARLDQDRYASGCKTLLNAVCLVHGGVTKRPGFVFCGKAKSVDQDGKNPVRLLPFVLSALESFVLELGHNYARIWQNGQQIEDGGEPLEFSTPYSRDDLNGIRTTQSADTLFILHPAHAPRRLQYTVETGWIFSLLPLRPMPFLPQNTGNIRIKASAHTGDVVELIAASQIENGDFASGVLAPWENKSVAPGTASVSGGRLVLTPNSYTAAAEQAIRVEPGYTYRLSADTFDNPVIVSVGTFSGDDSLFSDTWTAGSGHSAEFFAGPGLTTVFVRFTRLPDGFGAGSVDNVECSPRYWPQDIVSDSGSLLFGDNSDFENSIGNWAKVAAGNPAQTVEHNPATKKMDITTIVVHQAGPCVAGINLAVVPNTQYRVSFDISGIDSSSYANCWIGHEHYPADGYSSIGRGSNYTVGQDGEKEVFFTVPDGVTSAWLQFAYFTWAASGTWTASLDNVTVTALGASQIGGGTTQYKLAYVTAGVSAHVEASASAVYSSAITVQDGTVEYEVTGNFNAVVELQRSINEGATWEPVITGLGPGRGSIEEPDEGVQYRIGAKTRVSGTAYCKVFQTQYYPSGYAEIFAWVDDFTVLAKVLGRIPSLEPTYLWSKGAWSNTHGFPSLGCFYENRLMLAATPGKPNTVWGSKTDDYNNFGVSFFVTDSDAVSFSLLSRESNAICWMEPSERLRLGTSRSEWWLAGATDSSPLTPFSVMARQESWVGAAPVDSVRANQQILFARRDGRRICATSYTYEQDRYIPVDISLLAEHLFADSPVKQMAFMQYPHSLVWVLTENGRLLCLTVNEQQLVVGWARQELGSTKDSAFVESLCVIPGQNADELWAAIYPSSTENTPFIERLAPFFESTSSMDAVFLDSCLSFDFWNDDPDKELSLAATGTWDAQDDGALTATGHAPFVAEDIDCHFILKSETGLCARVKVTGFVSDTQVEVVFEDAIPACLQNSATGLWARMANKLDLTGLFEPEQVVSLVADGIFAGFATVDENCMANLAWPAARALAGSSFVTDISPMPLGAAEHQGANKRIHQVVLRLHKSLGGNLGSDENHLDPLPGNALPQPEACTQGLAVFTGDIAIDFDGDVDTGGNLLLRQAEPYPMTVLGMKIQMELGDR